MQVSASSQPISRLRKRLSFFMAALQNHPLLDLCLRYPQPRRRLQLLKAVASRCTGERVSQNRAVSRSTFYGDSNSSERGHPWLPPLRPARLTLQLVGTVCQFRQFSSVKQWSERRDSNTRHLAPKASALPTALHSEKRGTGPAQFTIPVVFPWQMGLCLKMVPRCRVELPASRHAY